MGTKIETGFTIIETMLFLAIAGALTVGVLVGSGLSINQQRYRDSVNTLKSFIQQQYSEVANVLNDRSGSEACADGVVTQAPETTTTEARGTSECMILGRFITVDATGQKVTAANVVGYRTPGVQEADSDIAEITTNYRLGVSTVGQEVTEVAWGSTILKPGTADPMSLSMLILRSPLSGSIMTYSAEGQVTDLRSLVTIANSSTAKNLCLDSPSGAVGGKHMSVQIDAFATNQSAISVPPESTSVCG